MTEPQIEITAEVVRGLLRDQHPDLAELPVTFGARGWGNQLWRLGEQLAVRVPWVGRSSDELLLKEYEWLPTLAPRLPLTVPVPQRLGAPSERYPRPWIVTTWVPGEPADRAPVTRGADAAEALAGFLSALHQPAPPEAPVSMDGRGTPLADCRKGFEHFLGEARRHGLIPDPGAVIAVFEEAAAAPPWPGPPLWLHADLHPANVLTADGTLCGVVDFGDLCVGDPACDLASAWILLPTDSVDRFRAAYRPTADGTAAVGPTARPAADSAVTGRPTGGRAVTGGVVAGRADDATWRRARGWAVIKALVCLLIGDAGDHGRPGGKPTWGPPGRASLERLIESSA